VFGIQIGKKRKQNCLLLTEDGRVLNITLPVVKGYIVSEKTGEAWELFPDSHIPEKSTSRLFQVITERDCAPLSLDGHKQGDNKRQKEGMTKIAQENASAARANIWKKSVKNKFAEALLLIAIIFGIVIGMVVIFGLFASGKLHMPGAGGGGIFG
jgi:hypothetical protein